MQFWVVVFNRRVFLGKGRKTNLRCSPGGTTEIPNPACTEAVTQEIKKIRQESPGKGGKTNFGTRTTEIQKCGKFRKLDGIGLYAQFANLIFLIL